MERATWEVHLKKSDFFLPPIALDSSRPLHAQIAGQIASAIRNGDAQAGARLPSTRTLAKLLGVSRNTVLAAYDILASEDLVRGERGSGMHVQGSARGALFELKDVIRESGYPVRVLGIGDGDGNPIYLRF
jgi:DNA-binding GntR family transcriptional regulator